MVIRYGVKNDWHYLVTYDDASTVFSDQQGAAQRFESFEAARATIRLIAASCEDSDVVRTMRPVRLYGTRVVFTRPQGGT